MTNPIPYSFVTTFTIAAAPNLVWDTLLDFKEWGIWWKAVQKVTTRGEGKDQVVTIKVGHFGYYLTFSMQVTDVKVDKEIRFDSKGDLQGAGLFTLEKAPKLTTVVFYWDIVTTKPWMNATAPVLSRFFIMSHAVVMREFIQGLSEKLNAKVLKVVNKGKKI